MREPAVFFAFVVAGAAIRLGGLLVGERLRRWFAGWEIAMVGLVGLLLSSPSSRMTALGVSIGLVLVAVDLGWSSLKNWRYAKREIVLGTIVAVAAIATTVFADRFRDAVRVGLPVTLMLGGAFVGVALLRSWELGRQSRDELSRTKSRSL